MTVCTTAQDKLGTTMFQTGSITTKAANAQADSAQNVLATMSCNWEKSGDGVISSHSCNWYAFRVAPTGAEYPYAPIGSLGFLFVADSTTTPVINTSAIYIKTIGGWEKLLTAGGATSGTAGAYPIYTGTSNKIVDIRAKFSTASGDNRGIYSRCQYAGTTAQGEAGRFYSEIQSTADSVHGIHATAEVSTGGSVTGQAVAGRFTAATITGLTLSAGALYAITAQSNNVSTALNMTDSAHIRIEDLSTYGMYAPISLGTIIGRSTSKSALGPYSYVSGKMTFAAAGVSAAIRVKTPDGTFYIPMYLQGDVS